MITREEWLAIRERSVKDPSWTRIQSFEDRHALIATVRELAALLDAAAIDWDMPESWRADAQAAAEQFADQSTGSRP